MASLKQAPFVILVRPSLHKNIPSISLFQNENLNDINPSKKENGNSQENGNKFKSKNVVIDENKNSFRTLRSSNLKNSSASTISVGNTKKNGAF